MKKKLISIFICSFLIMFMVGCGTNKKIESNIEIIEDIFDNETVESEEKENQKSEKVIYDVSEGDMEKDLQSINQMMPLIDSIMLCMFENNYEFDTTNSNFVWSVMVYYVGNYLSVSSETVFSEDYTSVILSKTDTSEYMKGYILNSIPKFNENGENSLITENENYYIFALGDRGLSKSKLVGFSKNTDDSFDVDIQLITLDDESEICTATFHMETINDKSKYFPLVIVNATIQKPQPTIQSGTIIEMNEENILLEVNGETKTYFLNENASNQIKTKDIGRSIDVMIDSNTIINILN